MAIHSSKALARIMCEVTEEHLYHPKLDWIHSKAPSLNVRFEVGSGKSTYMQLNRSRTQCKINYGMSCAKEMVDPLHCVRWTHGYEMVERGYWHEDFTPASMLAAVILHEFAHLIQFLHTWDQKGSHNDLFYKILDRMHASPYANRVLNAVRQKFNYLDIEDTFKNGLKRIPDSQIKQWSNVRNKDQGFIKIDKIYHPCTVTKVNKKSIDVLIGGRKHRTGKLSLLTHDYAQSQPDFSSLSHAG